MTEATAGGVDRGPALKLRREELGLSLAQVAADTKIPVEHLVAIEEGRIADLPAGPYAAAYLRTLEDHLDVPLGEATPTEVPPKEGEIPLWAVRWLAAGSVLVVFVIIGWQTWQPGLESSMDRQPAEVITREVKITPRKTARLRVVVDDEVALDKKVPGGDTLAFAGEGRIEVDVPSVEAVRIEYDGKAIVPQGRQDAPRRLVFIDDLRTDR